MKNMAYWKGKNSAPLKMTDSMALEDSAAGELSKQNPKASVTDKVDATVEKKVNKIVNKDQEEGLV